MIGRCTNRLKMNAIVKISKIEKGNCILKHEESVTMGSSQVISVISGQTPVCVCGCGRKVGEKIIKNMLKSFLCLEGGSRF